MRKFLNISAAVAASMLLLGAGGATAASLITSKNIKNGTIKMADISSSAKKALKGNRGPQGPQGPGGAQGIQGVAGGFDPAKVTYVTGPTRSFAPGEIEFVTATCPAGTKLLGGGYFSNIMHVAASKTYGDGQTWSVMINNDNSFSIDANAHAICAAK